MDFHTLSEQVSPRLKQISIRYKGYVSFIDEEDLYQEMLIHLWNNFKDGVPAHINEAYIIRGCEFHTLNYLRKAKENIKILSLEMPINGNGDILGDTLSSTNKKDYLDEYKELIVEEVKRGLSEREKDVFSFLSKGYTVREVGHKLGVSHVTIVKLKQGMVRKCQERTKS